MYLCTSSLSAESVTGVGGWGVGRVEWGGVEGW